VIVLVLMLLVVVSVKLAGPRASSK
jgi:hypothetical protein